MQIAASRVNGLMAILGSAGVKRQCPDADSSVLNSLRSPIALPAISPKDDRPDCNHDKNSKPQFQRCDKRRDQSLSFRILKPSDELQKGGTLHFPSQGRVASPSFDRAVQLPASLKGPTRTLMDVSVVSWLLRVAHLPNKYVFESRKKKKLRNFVV